MKPHNVINIRLQSTKHEENLNTREAAEKRRQTINEQIDAFFSGGGKVEKLPAYDE